MSQCCKFKILRDENRAGNERTGFLWRVRNFMKRQRINDTSKNKDGIELDQDWHESCALGFPYLLANFKFEFDNSYH